MTEVSKLFDFACANPDYWELMRETREPPEVAELDSRRRDAFNAARKEVQRLYAALLDEIHKKIKTKAAGTAMEAAFDKSFNRPSYEKAVFLFPVFTGRGKGTNATISLAPGTNGRISAYCGLGTAAGRQATLVDAFKSTLPKERLQIDGAWVYVEEFIPQNGAFSDIAARLVEVFWPGVLAYSEKLATAAEPGRADKNADDE